jgi:hypothetical protein
VQVAIAEANGDEAARQFVLYQSLYRGMPRNEFSFLSDSQLLDFQGQIAVLQKQDKLAADLFLDSYKLFANKPMADRLIPLLSKVGRDRDAQRVKLFQQKIVDRIELWELQHQPIGVGDIHRQVAENCANSRQKTDLFANAVQAVRDEKLNEFESGLVKRVEMERSMVKVSCS